MLDRCKGLVEGLRSIRIVEGYRLCEDATDCYLYCEEEKASYRRESTGPAQNNGRPSIWPF